MNKTLLLVLIALSVALACHPSCGCSNEALPHTCDSCPDANSTMDSVQRSCPCNAGYYSSFTDGYKCNKSLSTGSEVMDSCHIEIGKQTSLVRVFADCYFDVVNTVSTVHSDVSLNFDQTFLSDDCKAAYRITAQYKVPNTVDTYINVDPKYFTTQGNSAIDIHIPLIDLYTVATLTSGEGSAQITQNVDFQLLIGHTEAVIRKHTWTQYIFTNRDQVQVFAANVDIQRTDGCQNGEFCKVVADLTTESYICGSTACTAAKSDDKFIVGDIFYAKIWFTDATYTNKLVFQSLYFKNNDGRIFDFSAITESSWSNGALIVHFPLVEPTTSASIQINMKITGVSLGLRNLAASKEIKQQFTASIFNDPNASTDSASSASAYILAFVNLIAFVLLF